MNLLQMSFTGAVMILAVTVIRAIAINKVPKKTFLVLWGIALVRLMIPFSLPSWFSIYSLWNREMPTEGMNTAAGTLIPVIPAGHQAATPHNTAGPMANVSAPEIIWILGCVLCAFFFAAAYWKSYKEFQMSLPVRNDGIEKWLETHPTRRTITVRQSSLVSSPLTYGVMHPVILLPKTTVWNNEETLHYVLTHELVHIKRFDIITKVVLAVALCVHWFNPLVWVMYVLANRDIELSCDETVIRQFGENTRAAYAKVLISMEETRSGFTPLCNNFSRNAIEERITAIMKTRKTTVVSLVLAAVIVAGTTTVFATSALAESKGSMDTNYYETETSEGVLTSYTDDNGEIHYVLDDGNTTRTLSAEEFEQEYPSPVIEWWTYDEYKNWLDNEKETLQSIIGQKGWTSAHGEFVWTQEMVDETIAEYEKVLQDIKDGMMYSKTVDGEQDIMVGYNPEDTVTSSSYDYFVKLENGEEKFFGPYDILQNMAITDLADAIALKLDADLMETAIAGATLKAACAEADAITQDELEAAFALFGDKQNANEFAGVYINSKLFPSLLAMDGFTATGLTYTTPNNGIVQGQCVGFYRGAPVWLTDNSNRSGSAPECKTLIVKHGGLGKARKAEPEFSEEYHATTFYTDVVADVYGAHKVLDDSKVVLLAKTITG